MGGEIKVSTAAEIGAAVGRANEEKESWGAFGVAGRAKLLLKLWEEFRNRKEELALLETREMGMPIKQSLADLDSGLDYFKWYLDNAETYLKPKVTFEDSKALHTVYYEPTGTAAVISPWNFPFSNFIWGVIPNLVVGNTVVFKHAEDCIGFGAKVGELAGKFLPKGVFYAVHGGPKEGRTLVNQELDIICFTGSMAVGQEIYRVAARKFIRAVLELGGSAPGIVFEDADLDSVLESVYFGKFLNCGQVCDGLKRLIVHKSVFDKTVEKLRLLVESKNVGNPEDMKTDIGPLVSEKQLKTLEGQVKNALGKGAKIITGGRRAKLAGNYYLPTLLVNIKPSMRVWKEEVFGPVLPIVSFSSEEEAVKLANDTIYGLGGYIFTKNRERALRVAGKIKTGMVAVNNSTYILPCNPFGGYKNSGIGREHGKYGLRELCQIKVVSMEK